MTRNQLITIGVTGLLIAVSGLAQAEDLASKQIDSQITEQVQEKLAMDEPSMTPRIEVRTREGVVTLAGLGLTPEDIQTAVRDANGTNGVVRVENLLRVG